MCEPVYFYHVPTLDYVTYQLLRLSISQIHNSDIIISTYEREKCDHLRCETSNRIIIEDYKNPLYIFRDILDNGKIAVKLNVNSFISNIKLFNEFLCESTDLLIYDYIKELCTSDFSEQILLSLISLGLKQRLYYIDRSVVIMKPHMIGSLTSMINEDAFLTKIGELRDYSFDIIISARSPNTIVKIMNTGLRIYPYEVGRITVEGLTNAYSNTYPWHNNIDWCLIIRDNPSIVSYYSPNNLESLFSLQRVLDELTNTYIFYPHLDVESVGDRMYAINTLEREKKFDNFGQLVVRFSNEKNGLYVMKQPSLLQIPKIINQIWLSPLSDDIPMIDFDPPIGWTKKIWLCDCISDAVLGRWKHFYCETECIKKKEMILAFAILDYSGGIILAPQLVMMKSLPEEVLYNDFFILFKDEKCSTNLSDRIFGSVPNASVLNQIYNTLALDCSYDKTLNLIKYTYSMVYPSGHLDKYLIEYDNLMNDVSIKIPNIIFTTTNSSNFGAYTTLEMMT